MPSLWDFGGVRRVKPTADAVGYHMPPFGLRNWFETTSRLQEYLTQRRKAAKDMENSLGVFAPLRETQTTQIGKLF